MRDQGGATRAMQGCGGPRHVGLVKERSLDAAAAIPWQGGCPQRARGSSTRTLGRELLLEELQPLDEIRGTRALPGGVELALGHTRDERARNLLHRLSVRVPNHTRACMPCARYLHGSCVRLPTPRHAIHGQCPIGIHLTHIQFEPRAVSVLVVDPVPCDLPQEPP